MTTTIRVLQLPGLKNEANAEVPYTCVLSNDQQGAAPLVAERSLILVDKLIEIFALLSPTLILELFYICTICHSYLNLFTPQSVMCLMTCYFTTFLSFLAYFSLALLILYFFFLITFLVY